MVYSYPISRGTSVLLVPPARPFPVKLSRSKAVFLVWPAWTPGKGLPVGKQQRDIPHGPGAFQKAIGPLSIVNGNSCCTVERSSPQRNGRQQVSKIMLDSGYTVTMIQECVATSLPAAKQLASNELQFDSAAGELVAIDILEVPQSYRNTRYLLVIQDCFTKWADAIPLPDQTAVRITNALVKIFTDYGLPDSIHSDQGRNFEKFHTQTNLGSFWDCQIKDNSIPSPR